MVNYQNRHTIAQKIKEELEIELNPSNIDTAKGKGSKQVYVVKHDDSIILIEHKENEGFSIQVVNLSK